LLPKVQEAFRNEKTDAKIFRSNSAELNADRARTRFTENVLPAPLRGEREVPSRFR
jgi:hypothetical protein